MTLKEFTDDRVRRAQLARACGTTGVYLRRLALGYRRPRAGLAKRIEAASRELGPEGVSAIELLLAEPVAERRRYVRRAKKEHTAPTGESAVDCALRKVLFAVEEAVAELEESEAAAAGEGGAGDE